MFQGVYNVEIEDSPFAPPIGIAGNLVISVRSPRSANSVTVIVNPNVADFSATVATPPGFDARNLIALTPTDDTVQGGIRVGDAASKHFTTGGKEYRITLQEIGVVTHGGQSFPVYHFFIQEEERGASDARKATRQSLLEEHVAAIQSNDSERIRRTAGSFAESVAAELAPALDDLRRFATVLYNKGVALRELGRRNEERRAYSELIEELDVPDGIIQEQVAQGLFARAFSYDADAMDDLAVADYGEIDRRYRNLPGLQPMTMVARSLFNMALALRDLGRHEEMRQAAQVIVTRYGSRAEPALADQVARARELLA